MKFSKYISSIIKLLSIIIRIQFKKIFRLNQTDYRRWTNINNLNGTWEYREPILATMINPNSTVLEFGAGLIRLPEYLPENCTYIPSDIVKRRPEVLICDLNNPNIPFLPKVDVAVFSGVLEYIENVPRIINHLSNKCNAMVISYVVTQNSKKKLKELLLRRSMGWVNDYTEEEIIALFQDKGFVCVKKIFWNNQIICQFLNTKSSGTFG
ncbi:methyltransferase domain-containing protein [Chloroflexota bacterium]